MADSVKKSRWLSDEEDQPKEVKITKKRKSETKKKYEEMERVPERPVVKSPPAYPYLRECRHVDCYERLNHIEEGSYGIVFRARDKETGDIVALKKLKLQLSQGGFPVTSLREIHALVNIKHPNIVNVREIVMGNHMEQ